MQPHDPRAWLWLLLGAALLAVSQGRWAVPAAAWLAPVFLVRFVRDVRLLWSLPGVTLAHALAWEIAYTGTVPLPAAARLGMFLGLSLVFALVLLADRRAARRTAAFVATLVLPCGWVAFDFASALFSPSGSWGSIAYTFARSPVLVQLVSVTGWVGLTFLVGWVAASVNWAWDRWREGAPVRRGLAVCAGVLVAVFVFGGVRLAWPRAGGDSVRVAAIVAPGTFDESLEEVWAYTRGVEIPEATVQEARSRIAASQEEHFALVEREIAAGARLVVWAEANAALTEAEEPRWMARAQELARREGVYIGMGLTVFRPRSGRPTLNKLVLVTPDGEVAWEFLKATRVPGRTHVVGDGVLPRLDTPHGLLTAAICFDMDFPRLLQQAGRMRADIVLAPSNDWEEVRRIHADMAVVRAIEQGFTLVRPTKDGISVVADPWGRIVGEVDVFQARDPVLVAQAPTRGVRTLYSTTGDLFAWGCVLGFALSVLGSGRVAGS